MTAAPTKVNWGTQEVDGYSFRAKSSIEKPISFGHDNAFIAVPPVGDKAIGASHLVLRQHVVTIGDQIIVPSTATATNWGNSVYEGIGLKNLKDDLRKAIEKGLSSTSLDSLLTDLNKGLADLPEGFYINPLIPVTSETPSLLFGFACADKNYYYVWGWGTDPSWTNGFKYNKLQKP